MDWIPLWVAIERQKHNETNRTIKDQQIKE